jgi:hypothetical protein
VAVAKRGFGELRLTVVGGSPASFTEVMTLIPRRVAFRVAYGSRASIASKVKRDVSWAHLVVVWGSTELSHSVSAPYVKEARLRKVALITCPRRGVQALLDTATQFVLFVSEAA